MSENYQKQKLSSSKKIVLIFCFAVLFSFSNVKKADAWMDIPAAFLKQAMEEIFYSIKGMMMGSLKQAAVKMLSQQMDSLISGSSGGNIKFITDWQDYLIDAPARNAQTYANDYISQALSGRGSVSYISAGSVLGASTMADEGFGKGAVLGDASDLYSDPYATDYYSIVEDIGQKIIYPETKQYVYTATGDAITDLISPVANGVTIWDAEADFRKKYDSLLAQEQQIAYAKSLAGQGFLPEESSGMTIKPGILFKEMEANMENLPNLAMTSATSIGELIAATVSKAISGAANRAISGVESKINSEVNKVKSEATQEINSTINSYGPGALYE